MTTTRLDSEYETRLEALLEKFLSQTNHNNEHRQLIQNLESDTLFEHQDTYRDIFRLAYTLKTHGSREQSEWAQSIVSDIYDQDEYEFCLSQLKAHINEQGEFWWDDFNMGLSLIPKIENLCAMIEMGNPPYDFVMEFNDDWMKIQSRHKSIIKAALQIGARGGLTQLPIHTTKIGSALYPW